jgi:hypothetical protein
MGRPAILRHIESDSGTLSGGSWQSTLPLSNIRTQDIMRVARSTSASQAHAQFRIDFGTTLTRYINLFLLLNHNLTPAGQFRVTLGANADGSSPGYDSTFLDAWRPVVVFGANPFGGFGWDGTSYPEGFVSPPTIRLKIPTAHRAVGNGGHRYMHVYLKDTANPAGFLQVGRLLAGPVWQPEVGADFGISVQWADPSEVTRTSGGRRIAGNDVRYRIARASFRFLREEEAWGFVYEWQRLGKRREVWFEADYDRADEVGDRRSMYCALADIAPISQPLPARYATELLLEELT